MFLAAVTFVNTLAVSQGDVSTCSERVGDECSFLFTLMSSRGKKECFVKIQLFCSYFTSENQLAQTFTDVFYHFMTFYSILRLHSFFPPFFLLIGGVGVTLYLHSFVLFNILYDFIRLSSLLLFSCYQLFVQFLQFFIFLVHFCQC